MTATELQKWLVEHGQSIAVDGLCGPKTRAAIRSAFHNPCAEPISEAALAGIAQRLGCSLKQLRAVAKVESGGAAFDRNGRPKILFERHLFHRFTSGQWSPTIYSDEKGGGYNEDSWEKLTLAACKNAEAAFMAASWGKFQVLGCHWNALGYSSPIDMAYSTVTSEAAHYEMLARFIEHNGLKPALARLSANPVDNIGFARLYNGPAFKKFRYDTKLAEAMA